MKICDSCNQEKETKKCILNNSVTDLCLDCMKLEGAIEIKPDHIEDNINDLDKKFGKDMIVPNYNELIKRSREKLGLKIEDVSKSIREKIDEIEEIEEGKIIPNFYIARKLEKFFNIRLIEEYKNKYPSEKSTINFKSSSLKVSDLLESKDLK